MTTDARVNFTSGHALGPCLERPDTAHRPWWSCIELNVLTNVALRKVRSGLHRSYSTYPSGHYSTYGLARCTVATPPVALRSGMLEARRLCSSQSSCHPNPCSVLPCAARRARPTVRGSRIRGLRVSGSRIRVRGPGVRGSGSKRRGGAVGWGGPQLGRLGRDNPTYRGLVEGQRRVVLIVVHRLLRGDHAVVHPPLELNLVRVEDHLVV